MLIAFVTHDLMLLLLKIAILMLQNSGELGFLLLFDSTMVDKVSDLLLTGGLMEHVGAALLADLGYRSQLSRRVLLKTASQPSVLLLNYRVGCRIVWTDVWQVVIVWGAVRALPDAMETMWVIVAILTTFWWKKGAILSMHGASVDTLSSLRVV